MLPMAQYFDYFARHSSWLSFILICSKSLQNSNIKELSTAQNVETIAFAGNGISPAWVRAGLGIDHTLNSR